MIRLLLNKNNEKNFNIKNENENNFNIKNENNYLAYYTCFFGNDNNNSNVIKKIPSNSDDCYYFTNNENTIKKLQATKWKPIFVNIPIKNNLLENTRDSKEIKVCPNRFNILKKYKYLCYIDSKLIINESQINNIIRNNLEETDYLMVLGKHPFIKENIWNEYNECLLQERYFKEKDRYFKYINNQIKSGLSEKSEIHFQTGLIIRKNTTETNLINETWFEHIKECGIECQISFFFINQLFNKYICGIDYF